MSQWIMMGAMACAAILGGFAQVYMKRASGVSIAQAIPFFIVFVACYGVGVIINYLVYRAGGKIAVMYPIISISYIAAALFAWRLLGEPLETGTIFGIVVIMIGITIIGVTAVT